MRRLISRALNNTYAFNHWNFSNETEFKHEFFHQIASQAFQGFKLVCAEPNAPTPRLHAEGKVMNGNPAKADLLLCDPYSFQDFNYHVQHVIELKVALTRNAVRDELLKIDSYGQQFQSVWLVGSQPLGFLPQDLFTTHPSVKKLFVLGRTTAPRPKPSSTSKPMSFEAAVAIVRNCVDHGLRLYGSGRSQYQGFYWCNYEHEQHRGHTFPCEGDFNAQLYHNLRERLDPSLRINSEYRPTSLNDRRVDFVIGGPESHWVIPIEIKMNWDQFKPKFKDRQSVRAEIKQHFFCKFGNPFAP